MKKYARTMTVSVELGLGEGTTGVDVGRTGVLLGVGVGIDVGDGDGLIAGLGLTVGVGTLVGDGDGDGDGKGLIPAGPEQAATMIAMAIDPMTVDGCRMTRSSRGSVQLHDQPTGVRPHLPQVTKSAGERPESPG